MTRRSAVARDAVSSNSSGANLATELRTWFATCPGVWNSAYAIARCSISKITDSGAPSRIAAAVSRAMTVACAEEISPVARAEHVLGKLLTRVRAISIRDCAVAGASRSAVEISSRSVSSTPDNGPPPSLGCKPATAAMARWRRA